MNTGTSTCPFCEHRCEIPAHKPYTEAGINLFCPPDIKCPICGHMLRAEPLGGYTGYILRPLKETETRRT